MRLSVIKAPAALLLTASLLCAPTAQAALFGDDEARRAIIELRELLQKSEQLQQQRLTEANVQSAEQ